MRVCAPRTPSLASGVTTPVSVQRASFRPLSLTLYPTGQAQSWLVANACTSSPSTANRWPGRNTRKRSSRPLHFAHSALAVPSAVYTAAPVCLHSTGSADT